MTLPSMNETLLKGSLGKLAAKYVSRTSTEERHRALLSISSHLEKNRELILEANQKDVERSRENGATAAYIDRLSLDHGRIASLSEMLKKLVTLPDPLFQIKEETIRPNGLHIKHVTVPLGVIGIIYEARPNVTVDTAALALKTGNTTLLKGSSSTLHTNRVLVQIMQEALVDEGFPAETVQLIDDPDRTALQDMCHARGYLDVLIPRGGEKLIQTVVEQSTVPVIETGAGNCHVYIDESADPDMAINVAVDAKTQRPSVCNACETIVVHKEWLAENGQKLITALEEKGVSIHGDRHVQELSETIIEADEDDWKTEYLSLDVAMKTVPDIGSAISHISTYSTFHSESILTENDHHARLFFASIDAAAVYHNASTRFTDGEEFGYGAEVGISTQKLHARGPMGLPALTTTKAIISGTGQTKA
ncbi:glutamate-5-semialdehyde dehydrogenase [Salisediminibacterium selenitireducens]|uniref:Gamma-glutamyl phosphate reductase n=1 Tax=Bacillus selenitireducens (strain ATCC 700615 / DSM 15326 / MLS10) TaxID=439292 RepID=D6XUG5_BACIE|nr:glutamate-5-semialdehyde dehydrogenase [Salisediminibacterium selenitireducens]ADH99451.1 gamma-glutamyl phosphate reductase [[Bacillus] selenitireducens MLS10]